MRVAAFVSLAFALVAFSVPLSDTPSAKGVAAAVNKADSAVDAALAANHHLGNTHATFRSRGIAGTAGGMGGLTDKVKNLPGQASGAAGGAGSVVQGENGIPNGAAGDAKGVGAGTLGALGGTAQGSGNGKADSLP